MAYFHYVIAGIQEVMMTMPDVNTASHLTYDYRVKNGQSVSENIHSDDDHGMGLDLLCRMCCASFQESIILGLSILAASGSKSSDLWVRSHWKNFEYYIYIYIYIYIYMYLYAYVCVMYKYICVYDMHVYVCLYLYVYVCICVYVREYVCTWLFYNAFMMLCLTWKRWKIQLINGCVPSRFDTGIIIIFNLCKWHRKFLSMLHSVFCWWHNFICIAVKH